MSLLMSEMAWVQPATVSQNGKSKRYSEKEPIGTKRRSNILCTGRDTHHYMTDGSLKKTFMHRTY
jgi:hypothetical protein